MKNNSLAEAEVDSVALLGAVEEADAAAKAADAMSKRAETSFELEMKRRADARAERALRLKEGRARGRGTGGSGKASAPVSGSEVLRTAAKFYPNLDPKDIKPGSMNDKRLRDRMFRMHGKSVFLEFGEK